jgi:hypothetical protein
LAFGAGSGRFATDPLLHEASLIHTPPFTHINDTAAAGRIPYSKRASHGTTKAGNLGGVMPLDWMRRQRQGGLSENRKSCEGKRTRKKFAHVDLLFAESTVETMRHNTRVRVLCSDD